MRHVAMLLMIMGLAPISVADSFDLHAEIAAANPGDTIRVPAGQYLGPIVIDKPVILIAEPHAILTGQESGDVIHITAPDVTIDGFTIEGTGISLDRENAGVTVLAPRATIINNTLRDVLFGIYLKKAPDSVIRGNVIGGKPLDIARRGDGIRLWYSSGTRVEHNTVHNSRDVVMWFSSGVTLRHNTIRHGRYGLHFMYSDGDVIEDNLVTDNSVGAFLMYSRNLELRRNTFARNRGPSGYGIGLKDMDGIVATDNRFIDNRIGIYLDNSPREIDITHHFQRNAVVNNDIGVAFMPSVKRNDFSNNAFVDNAEQVAVLGGGKFAGNRFTVEGRGNFWSDYTGYDLDGDGVGDMPMVSRSLFENLTDREPKLRLFMLSPAQQAVELAARAVPALLPEPKFTDSAPLTEPIHLNTPPQAAGVMWPMSTTSIALLGGVALVLGLLRRRDTVIARIATEPVAAPVNVDEDATRTVGETGQGLPPVLIRVDAMTCRFGRYTAVDRLSFELQRGQSLALWGHNGAGKTTAIKALLQLVRSTGEVEVDGLNLRHNAKAVRHRIGYVPQELCFYDNWTGVEMLGLLARLKRVGLEQVPGVLAEVGLTDHAAKRIGAMSGGMKQRLALAAALLGNPPILVLDEMTSNLDAAARRQFVLLLEAQKRAGKTIMFASHRMEEVAALADRVIVLEAGQVRHDCIPAELPAAIGQRPVLRVSVDPGAERDTYLALSRCGYDVELVSE